jgi:DNA repair exonuclease SbcCD ATPase subunit
MDSLKAEFSKRLGDLERKLAAIKKERDDLKKTLSSNADNTSNTSNTSNNSSIVSSSSGNSSSSSGGGVDYSSLYADKDKEAATLRMEGEKLAKRILSLEAHSKTLKATKLENDKAISSLKERLHHTENLLETKISKIKELEEESKKYSETYFTMKDISDSTVRQLEEKSRVFESTNTKVEEYKTALEKAWVEIAELKKGNAAQIAKTSTLLKECEAKIKEEFTLLSDKQNKEYKDRENLLSNTIQELRNTISRIQDQQAWKEEQYISEIHTLKARVQLSESRNEEMASSVPETTRPLLRQIETLQNTMNERSKIWEELEKQYNNRILDAEERAQSSYDKEKQMNDTFNELLLKVKSLESEISNYRSSITRLNAELEFNKSLLSDKQSQLDTFSTQIASLHLQIEHEKQSFAKQEAKLKGDFSDLTVKYDILHKDKLELQDKWSKVIEDNKSSLVSSSINNNVSPNSSSASLLVKSNSQTRLDMLNTLSSASNSTTASLTIEKYQSLLKQREGEIVALQEQLTSLSKTRGTVTMVTNIHNSFYRYSSR